MVARGRSWAGQGERRKAHAHAQACGSGREKLSVTKVRSQLRVGGVVPPSFALLCAGPGS